MPREIVIDKPMQTFDDGTDFSRSNPNRKPFGKADNAQSFYMGDEYSTPPAPPEPPAPAPPAPPTPPEPPAPEAKRFTHKLANGTVIEAPTIEALAAAIEQALSQQSAPAPVDFEDKPVYTPLEFKGKPLSLTEQAELLNLWKENPQASVAKLMEALFGQSVEVVADRLTRAEQQEFVRQQREEGAKFVKSHPEYEDTDKNAKKLFAYLNEKQKPVTKRNLEVALNHLIAAGDKSLKKAEAAPPPPAPDPNIIDPGQPPVIVPSNQGSVPPSPESTSVDTAKFAAMTLDQQKKFFATLRR